MEGNKDGQETENQVNLNVQQKWSLGLVRMV